MLSLGSDLTSIGGVVVEARGLVLAAGAPADEAPVGVVVGPLAPGVGGSGGGKRCWISLMIWAGGGEGIRSESGGCSEKKKTI